MDILIIILAISIGSGLLMASFPAKVKCKEEKHRIVRKLRAKAHHMELTLDIAKNANDIEKKALENLKSFLHDIASEVEKL